MVNLSPVASRYAAYPPAGPVRFGKGEKPEPENTDAMGLLGPDVDDEPAPKKGSTASKLLNPSFILSILFGGALAASSAVDIYTSLVKDTDNVGNQIKACEQVTSPNANKIWPSGIPEAVSKACAEILEATIKKE
jgi:hypothetical protein